MGVVGTRHVAQLLIELGGATCESFTCLRSGITPAQAGISMCNPQVSVLRSIRGPCLLCLFYTSPTP